MKRYIPVLIFFVSFVCLFFLQKPFVTKWDGLFYVVNIFDNYPSNLNLGRPLFVYLHIFIFNIYKFFFDVDITSIPNQIFFLNNLFSSIVVVTLFLLLKDIFKVYFIPLLSVGLVYSNSLFFEMSGNALPDMMMLALALVGVYYLLAYIDKKNSNYHLIIAAIFFGLSFEAKEQSIFFLSTLLCAVFLFPKSFTWKSIGIFIFVYLLVALIGPVIIIAKYENHYLGMIKSLSELCNKETPLRIVIFGVMVLIIGIYGFYVDYLKFIKNLPIQLKKYIFLLVSLLIPGIGIFILFTFGNDSYKDSHYFLTNWIVLIIVFVTLLYRILKKFKCFSKCSIFIGIVILAVSIINCYPSYQRLHQEAGFRLLFLDSLKNFKEKTLFIVGGYSDIAYYHTQLPGNNSLDCVFSGWAFSEEYLNQKVELALSNNYTILVDRNHIGTENLKYIDKLLEKFPDKKELSLNRFIIKSFD